MRLVETRGRIGELVALAAQLEDVSARLAAAPTAGACGDDCACVTVTIEPHVGARTPVPLTLQPRPDAIACSLQPAAGSSCGGACEC